MAYEDKCLGQDAAEDNISADISGNSILRYQNEACPRDKEMGDFYRTFVSENKEVLIIEYDNFNNGDPLIELLPGSHEV